MRIVTRGLGRNKPGYQGFITMGYGRRFIEEVIRIARRGRSSAQRLIKELEDVVVWAKLIRVNDEKPKENIQGQLSVKVNLSTRIAVMAENVSTRTRSAWEDIKITINRVK
jgi:hypothetical protein